MAVRTFDTQYHVDPTDGSDTAPYDTWAKAATSLQTIADLATSGDGCYCRNTQTLAAPIDFDTNSGTTADGYITFIGCADNGDTGAEDGTNVDGTPFVLDGNSAAAQCILATTHDYIRIENFELTGATGDGYDATDNADYWIWINCLSHNNGASGWDMDGCDFHTFIKCIAHTNVDGWSDLEYDNTLLFCVSYINTDHGFTTDNRTVFIGCLAHDNGPDAGDAGYSVDQGNCRFFNCVADGEVTGIELFQIDGQIIVGCRITNNAEGIDFSSELALCGWNYFHGNTADLANPVAWSDKGLYAAYIVDETDDGNTNISKDADWGLGQATDADDGYENRANDDFNIKTSRTYNGDGTDTAGLNIGS